MSEFRSSPLALKPALGWIVAGAGLPSIVVALLTLTVWGQPGGIWWDEPILRAIHTTLRPGLNALAAVLSELGVYSGVVPGIGAIALLLLLLRRWAPLGYVLSLAIAAGLINRTAKAWIHRPRPHLWQTPYPQYTDFAFPSGHAMASMTLACIIVALAWPTRWRKLAIIASSLWVLGVGWSRLYLGVHYPSDIVAGWLMTIALAISLYGLILHPRSDQDPVDT
jgi:membrane-associated phospholipid phosphatase